MIAINYLRWSSAAQNQGSSLTRQREKFEEFCARMDWSDRESEVLDDAVSGWSGENMASGNLSKLLARLTLEGGDGRCVVVENMDRASRLEVATVLRFVFNLVDTGASLALIDNAMIIDRHTIKNQVEQIKLIVEEAQRARSEGDRKSALSRAGWSAIRLGMDVTAEFAGTITDIQRHSYGIDISLGSKRRTAIHELTELIPGFEPEVGDFVEAQQLFGRVVRKVHTGGTVPAWLSLTPCRRAFGVREDKAAVVREMYELRAGGTSFTGICRVLNARGEPTFRGGNGWQPSAVKSLIGNRGVIGEYQHQSRATGEKIGDPDPSYFPPVVDLDLFQRATDLRLANAMPGRGGEVEHRNLLADLARCGSCGTRMRYNRKRAGVTYYQCSNYDLDMGCNHGKMWRGEPVTTAILDHVLHLAMDDQRFQSDDDVRDINRNLAKARNEAANLDVRLNRIIDEIEESGPSDRLRARRRDLEAKEAEAKADIAKLETSLALARGKVEPAEHVRRVAEIRADMSDETEIGLKARLTVKMSLNDLIESVTFTALGGAFIRLRAGVETIYVGRDGAVWPVNMLDLGATIEGKSEEERAILADYLRRRSSETISAKAVTPATIQNYYDRLPPEAVDELDRAHSLTKEQAA